MFLFEEPLKVVQFEVSNIGIKNIDILASNLFERKLWIF